MTTRRFVLLLLPLLATGCAVDSELHLSDRPAPVSPHARITLLTSRTEPAPPRERETDGDERAEEAGRSDASPATTVPHASLDLTADWAVGEDDVIVGAGRTLAFGRSVYPGPTSLEARFETLAIGASGRGGFTIADLVEIEGILGVEYVDLDVRLKQAGTRESESYSAIAAVAGAQAGLRLLPQLGIFGRWQQSAGFALDDDDMHREEGAVFLEFTPVRGVGLIGGWRWTEIEFDEGLARLFSVTTPGEIRARLSGAFVGLHLTF